MRDCYVKALPGELTKQGKFDPFGLCDLGFQLIELGILPWDVAFDADGEGRLHFRLETTAEAEARIQRQMQDLSDPEDKQLVEQFCDRFFSFMLEVD